MKKLLLTLLAFFSIYGAKAQCDYNLDLIDSYGDGWDSVTIDVLVDDVTVLSGAFASGPGSNYQIPVNDGSTITFVWNGTESWSSEVSWQIRDFLNDEVVASGNYYESPSGLTAICTAPSCSVPSALTASGITATSVDLTWTAGGTESLWDIELVDITAGGSATGTPTTSNISTNSYTISGLTSTNDYEVYLRAVCGAGDVSDWRSLSFTTPCPEISTFPSTTDFTLNPPTDCWSQAGDGTPSEGPTGTSSSWNAGRSFNGVPSNRVNLWSTGREEWLISPTYAIPTGDAHELILTLAVTDYNSTSADPNGMAGTDDEVQLLQTLDGGTTWTSLETWDSSNEPAFTGTAYTIDLTSVAGSSVQFALWATEGSASGVADYDFHVGGFTVRETPSCLDVTGLAIGNIVADTAELSWTDSNPTPAGLYQYELVDVTAGDVVLTTDTTASSPLSLTGLTTLNEYKIRVRANCGSVLSASYSAWSSYVSWTQVEAPGCPTNLTPIDGATDQDWRSVTLSWDAPTTGGAATSYSVLYGTTEAGMFQVATTTETSYTINGLNSDVTVFIGVNAVNAGGTSSSCTANSITTNAVGLACDTPVEVFEGTNTQEIHQYVGYNTFSYYSYTTTTGGTLDIGSCNEGVDTTLYILEPGCVTQLDYAGDTCATGTGTNWASNVSFEVNPNVEYIIAWYSNYSINNFDFDISLTPTCSGTTTTWDGTAWSNGAPDATSYAIMSGAYSTGTDGAITACVMQVDADVTIDGATDAAISEVLVMAGNSLTIDETSSLMVSGDFTNNGTVTLNSTEDDFSSLLVEGTATGDITYNRYVNVYDDSAGGGWDLVCSPVTMTIADFIAANNTTTQSTALSSTAGSSTTGFSGGWQLLDFSPSEDGATIDTVSLFLRYSGDAGGSIDLNVDLYELDAAVHGPANTNASPFNIPELNTGTPIETSASVSINSTTIVQTDFSFSSTIDSSKYYYVWIKGSAASGSNANIQFDFGVGDNEGGAGNNFGRLNHIVDVTATGSNIQVLGDDYAFSQYDNALGQWVRYATASQTGSFTAGQGYSMATTTGSTVAFTGTMQTTDQNINIINNNGLNGVGRRWNLVSNPFPSYIAGNPDAGTAAGTTNFMNANAAVIDSEFLAVYGWNGSSYDIYNNLSGAFSMAPGQGFWVAAANTTDTALSFTADMRTNSGTGDFVSGPQLLTHHVAVKLFNGETERATTDFYFRDGLTLGLDPGYDAAAFNQSTKLSSRLAMGSQETAFAMNAMDMDAMQNTRVPLEIRQVAGQAFRVSMTDVDLPEDIYVYLEDTLNGTLTSLKDQDFELVAQSDLSGVDRFFIVFKSNSVLSNGDTLGLSALNVYKANNESFVTIAGITPELEKLDVTIYSILGQTVREKSFNPNTATQRVSTQGLASGLYMVQIKSGNQTTVKKVIIK